MLRSGNVAEPDECHSSYKLTGSMEFYDSYESLTETRSEHHDEEKEMVASQLGPKVLDVIRPELLREKAQYNNNPKNVINVGYNI
ncbi:unnamed protein product [Angiostrongylus costaricensis]|uniref:Cytochrome P450 n=1 Tax=Angiostrongylus costaricensis TaxID=334426 RepID=A0A0R3PE07_ANGCS|nr:unnamed protein product [Angiostrongylus costaricensis]